MRRFFFIIVMCVQTLPVGAAEFVIPPYKLAFDNLMQWTQSAQQIRGTIALFTDEKDVEFSSNLIVATMETNASSISKVYTEIVDEAIQTQQRSLALYMVLEKRSFDKHGFSFKTLTAKYAYGKLDVVTYQVFMLQSEQARVYTFNFTCLVKDFPHYQPIFENVIQNITVTPE